MYSYKLLYLATNIYDYEMSTAVPDTRAYHAIINKVCALLLHYKFLIRCNLIKEYILLTDLISSQVEACY